MKTILKFRWVILILWIAAVAGLAVTAPSMETLVREKGQITVPDGYSFRQAADLQAEMNKDSKENGESTVLVFHSDDKLTSTQMEDIKSTVEKLKAEQEKLGILSITTHFDTKELEKEMVSEDGKTVLVLLGVGFGDRTASETREALYDAASGSKLEHYYTGNWLITEDVVESSQTGLKKTEGITVVFILVILFAVFRSAVTPFIPLISVGLSYIAAQSVVAFLVDRAGFPISTFTQIFMVAVMFGIGTDYCILLISRYKEELAAGGDKNEAILTTYKTAGKTVLVAGAAVLTGFVAIGFSEFSLYRSAVAVAVGVSVLLIALVTFVPVLLSLLGPVLFWPAKGGITHRQSRLWGTVGGFSVKRPLLALLIVAVVTVPFLSIYTGAQSFNSLDEVGSKYNSVKAFDLISDSFGPGESLPGSVVLKTDHSLRSAEGLAQVEQITRELLKADGVKTVRSATRPTGAILSDLQVADQAEKVQSGLGQGAEGLTKISSGLTEASGSLKANEPKLKEAADGASQLVTGTDALKNGVVQLSDGLKRIEQGLKDGSMGASELSAAMTKVKASADQLAQGSQTLLASYKKLETGLGQLSGAYTKVATEAGKLADGLTSVGQGLTGLGVKYPELKTDPVFLQTQGALTQLQDGATQLSQGLTQLNSQLEAVSGGLGQANAGLAQAAGGQEQLAGGLGQLAAGIGKLQQGFEQAAAGQGQVVGKLPELTGGIDKLSEGQKQFAQGFSDLGGQLSQLTDGLDQSVSGLNQVTDGIKSAQDYMKALSVSSDKQLAGWYAPDQALENADFQKALDTYLSPDGKIVRFDIIFEGNPYDVKTMEQTEGVKQAMDRAVKGTDLEKAEYAVGGVSSMNHDLKEISGGDYTRTVIFMLIGVAIILILLFRSLVIPIYIILSLLLTYFTSMAITEVIFTRILDYPGINWAVTFFAFTMLIALGVDYSIFLMARFKEYPELREEDAILEAMKNMGSVIMSAVVILGGTFAAMLPSGVLSILQIATVVLTGLVLYAFIMLPLFIPVMVRTFGPANWWPFMRNRAER
ncbi:efflux RND transporter permease subunit [Gorillibacterium timonense]|uniref:efflux RND transporter permease subunit n=1 Tax=Gorillibacterium timonense TaxID=1689269 RepID=UPI00071E4949|nr:MMPL family transporter [Gorillibacterium timonense]